MLLQTDGTVMVLETNTNQWHKLTPDNKGSYINGSWSKLRPMNDDARIPVAKGGPTYAPLYFASAILKTGKVLVAGGEYNTGIGSAESIVAQVYDPVTNKWKTIGSPPGWTQIGDSASCVLPDGRVMVGHDTDTIAFLNPRTLKWKLSGGTKGDSSSEETFTLLPDHTVLSVQCSNSPNAEKYIIATDKWVSAGATKSALPQPCPGYVAEIGPALLLPNGHVFAIGATGNTGIYIPKKHHPHHPGTWKKGPVMKDSTGATKAAMDAPAVLLINGKVLCIGSPVPNCGYPGPTSFFEYTPSTNKIKEIATPFTVANACYWGRFLLLPNGEVLFGWGTKDLRVYLSGGTPHHTWRPKITQHPKHVKNGKTYTLKGKQINGLSQACSYGDDAQSATNYPIIQVTNPVTHHVHYLRSHDFSNMGVATGHAVHSCKFRVKGLAHNTKYELRVIANGIASAAVHIKCI
jgi:hypothetical protein